MLVMRRWKGPAGGTSMPYEVIALAGDGVEFVEFGRRLLTEENDSKSYKGWSRTRPRQLRDTGDEP